MRCAPLRSAPDRSASERYALVRSVPVRSAPRRLASKRYAWVKKRFERTDVVAGATEAEAVVYNTGTLYGAWPDGTPFEGNRYVDRFVVRGGLIVSHEVWNDSAERILDPRLDG